MMFEVAFMSEMSKLASDSEKAKRKAESTRANVAKITGESVPKDFKANNWRAAGRGVATGLGYSTLGAVGGRSVGRRLGGATGASVGGNIGAFTGSYYGAGRGVKKSYQNQLREHRMKAEAKKLEKQGEKS